MRTCVAERDIPSCVRGLFVVKAGKLALGINRMVLTSHPRSGRARLRFGALMDCGFALSVLLYDFARRPDQDKIRKTMPGHNIAQFVPCC